MNKCEQWLASASVEGGNQRGYGSEEFKKTVTENKETKENYKNEVDKFISGASEAERARIIAALNRTDYLDIESLIEKTTDKTEKFALESLKRIIDANSDKEAIPIAQELEEKLDEEDDE